MMKHYLQVATCIALLCSPAAVLAATGTMEGGPGCGLGAMLWADSVSKKHIMQQSFIVTTNQTGFQTFGITSGTSGCTNDGVIAKQEAVNVFVGFNFDDLLEEMAQGSGEHLVGLAELAGIPAHLRSSVFLYMQEHYAMIVPHDNASPAALLDNLSAALASHAVMRRTERAE